MDAFAPALKLQTEDNLYLTAMADILLIFNIWVG